MVDLFPFHSHLKAWISSQTVTRTVLQGFQLSLSAIKMERKMSCICRWFLLSSCFLRCLCRMCAYLTQKLPKPMQPLPDMQDGRKIPQTRTPVQKGTLFLLSDKVFKLPSCCWFLFVLFFLPVLPTNK